MDGDYAAQHHFSFFRRVKGQSVLRENDRMITSRAKRRRNMQMLCRRNWMNEICYKYE